MSPDTTPATRRVTPVTVFAALGILALVGQVIVIGQWIAAGDIHSAPRTFSISTTSITLIWIEQALMAAGTLTATVAMWLSCRRRGEVTLWAMIVWGNWFTWWLGPLMMLAETSPTPNRYAIHIVGWGPYLPGWHNPNPEYTIETIIAGQCLMYPMIVIWVWAQMQLINWVTKRFPNWSLRRMLMVFLVTGVGSDIIIEGIFIIGFGTYAYPRGLQELSLFGGHWYQLPLPNLLLGGILMAPPWTFLLWQARRRGTAPWIFLGSERLDTRRQTTLRILAGIGYANVVIFTYCTIVGIIPLLGTDPVPPDTPDWIWPYAP